MSTATPTARRTVHYSSFDELLADAERMSAGHCRTVGRWTYPQILKHLALTADAMFDGFGFKAPWFARVLIAPLVRNSFLTKPMRAGFKLPKRAAKIIPAADASLAEALPHFRRAIGRFERETPTAEHPFIGKMAPQEAKSLALRHAELHMSFVVPESP
jgi:hypothetical protein